MKKIAVFFKHPNAEDYPFTKEEYRESYQELDRKIRDNGGEFFIVRDNDTYLGNGQFSKSWQFKNGELIETGKIKVDKIYDKGGFKNDNNVSVLNEKLVDDVCTDKWKTYKLFKKFCPKTIKVENEKEFLKALKKISGNKKVIKPVDNAEGHGVFIGNDEYLKKVGHEFPMLVQEFLDTSEGIPGVYKGIHDLRLVFINGEIIYSFYRTPPEGSLLANVAQGGSLTIISKEKIPEETFKIAKTIQKKFKNNYCFGVDVGFVKGKPKIIELNSQVALFSPKRGKEFAIFMEKLAKILTK